MIDPAIHRNPHPATLAHSSQAPTTTNSPADASATGTQSSVSRSQTIVSSSQTTVTIDGNRSSSSSVTAMYQYSETRYTPSQSYLANPSIDHATRHGADYADRQSATYSQQGFLTISSSTHSSASVSNEAGAGNASLDGSSIDRSAMVSGAAEVNPESNRTDAANTILAFIQQQLAFDLADGADDASLQSRLQAGLDGFMQGYSEAADQLGGLTSLPAEVAAQIEKTFNDVLQGVSDIAAKLGLQDPTTDLERKAAAVTAPAAPASSTITTATPELSLAETFASLLDQLSANPELDTLKTLLQASETFYSEGLSAVESQPGVSLDRESSQSRSFNLQLVTADGDKVNIRSYGDYGERTQTGNGITQYNESSLNNFKLTVEGDLDTEELKAINELLGKVNDVAETFFSGDVTAAFDQALQLGIESDEIARFAVNLQQTSYTRIEGRIDDSYGKVAAASEQRLSIRDGEHGDRHGPRFGNNPMQMLMGFVKQLEQIRSNAADSGFGVANIEQLSNAIGSQHFSGHPRSQQFGPFMGNMMAALERHHA